MKIYYSDHILPPGYRYETDEELRARIKAHILETEANPIKNNSNQYIDDLLGQTTLCRTLHPLKEGEKVMLRTYLGECEMPEIPD